MSDAKTPRFEMLDGLRGVAALVVVLSHSANAGLLPSVLGHGFGQMGVSLFYALSAFLLGHLYFHRPPSADALWRYAVNRAARVLPLFYAVIGLAVGLYLLTGQSFYNLVSVKRLVMNAGLVQGSSVLWSIPVELHYYVVFAALWWLHIRHGWHLSRLLLLGLATQLAVMATLRSLVPDAGVLNLAYWGHIFLAGLAFSQMPRHALSVRAVPLQTLALAALLIFALPELRRTLGLPVLPSYADPLTVGVPLFMLYLALRQAAALRILATPALRWLGGVSFGLYLLHMPVIYGVKALGLHQVMPGLGFGLVLVLSLACAALARHAVELPAQRALREWLKRDRKGSEGSDAGGGRIVR